MRRIMFLTTASAILAMSAGTSMAREGEGGGGGARGAEGARAGGEGVHVGVGNTEVHVGPNTGVHVETRGGARVAPSAIPHEGDRSAFERSGRGRDSWRYRYDNGAWWYWLPNNRWMYYDNGAWQDYAVDNSTTYDNSTATVAVPSDPNYYWYNSQWWYLLPGNRWSYYDHGSWRDGAPGMGPQRRETGYRGVLDNDEQHGPNQTPATHDLHPANPALGAQPSVKVAPHTDAPQEHGPVNSAPHIDAPQGHGAATAAPHAETPAGPKK
jgi:hypothetical protein